MHYLQLFFRDREKPILVPVAEQDGYNILNHLRDKTERLGFFEFASSLEHDIWLNLDRLEMVRLLLEMEQLPFDPQTIGPSKQFPEKEDEAPDLDEIRWHVTF
jgi:hypothetical protein